MNKSHFITEWTYTQNEWGEFVKIEKSNKKEDNLYYGIAILILAPVILMFARDTSFLTALLFSLPFAILLPFLRMKFSYPHLKKGIANPKVQIYSNQLLFNNKRIELTSNRKRIKSLKIIEAKNSRYLLEFDVQWLTGKGPTNDEFRVLIPNSKLEEAQELIKIF